MISWQLDTDFMRRNFGLTAYHELFVKIYAPDAPGRFRALDEPVLFPNDVVTEQFNFPIYLMISSRHADNDQEPVELGLTNSFGPCDLDIPDVFIDGVSIGAVNMP